MAIGLLAKRNKEVNKVVLVPLAEIVSNPNQPRKYFDPDELQELSRSIITNGLLQPVTLRRLESGGYELIAGERRTRAFRLLGRNEIPAIVEEYTDQQSAVLALIENLQRRDLNYFEEAIGLLRLMEQLGLNQQQLSARIGKAQSTVANKLRLLRYPPELQQMMLEAELTERHARAMLKLKDNVELEKAVEHVIQKRYNVEQTETYIERRLMKDEIKTRTRIFVVKDMRMFHNSINKACTMMNLAGIPIESKKIETEEHVEYTIRVPKSAVYKSSPEKKGKNQTRISAM